MPYPEAYLDYLVHFHGSRDYFECHEILEDYWKTITPIKRDSVWVGLIQLSVGMYHYRRQNLQGARRILLKARSIFLTHKNIVTELGLNKEQLLILLDETVRNIDKKKSYSSIDLPIQNEHLLAICKKKCQNQQFVWSNPSNMNQVDLIHRHILRNRDDVINERKRQLQIRKELNSINNNKA